LSFWWWFFLVLPFSFLLSFVLCYLLIQAGYEKVCLTPLRLLR